MEPNCYWLEDDDPEYGVWITTCGKTFQFEADGPTENEFRFCPFCGRSLKQKKD